MDHILEIAVVDDLEQDRERLIRVILSYARRRGLPWQVTGFPSGETILSGLTPGRFSIVFLDILMDGMDGMETARRLRAIDPDVLLVFVTTEADYALEGYEVEAAGFLIKGTTQTERRFQHLMERLERRLGQDEVLELAEGEICLAAGDVYSAEVRDHDMVFHIRDGRELVLRMTMEELRRLLPGDGRFFECHRGVMVNLDAVDTLDRQVITMADGEVLPVSRRRRADLERAYAARSIARLRGEL